jgi:hypothetical protein
MFQLLFVFRYLDNNRLTSWQWVFAGVDLPILLVSLVIGIIAAYGFSRSSIPDRHPVAVLFIFSFLLGGLFWKEPEVIVDTSRYFTQAKHLELYGVGYFIREWGRALNAWTDLPLLPFLYGIIFKVFGESRVYIQVLNTFLFSMTTVCAYFIGKALWNKEIGFNAGMLLSGIPYLLTQIPLMLADVGTMCFVLFSVLALTYALLRGGFWVLIAPVAVTSAFFSKFSSWIMLSVLCVIFTVFAVDKTLPLQTRHRLLKRGISVVMITLIPVALIVMYKYDVLSEQIRLLITYQKPALSGWRESFVSTYLFQIHALITMAALFSLYAAVRRRDIRYSIICWLPLLVIVAWVERIRYIVPIFPMLVLMAAYGLDEVRNRELRRFIVFGTVSVSLVIAIFVYLPFLKKMGTANLLEAGRYLDSLDTPSVEVITLPPKDFVINPAVSVPVLDLFTRKEISYAYKEARPPEEISRSPLRFTWTYENPLYYRSDHDRDFTEERPLVIITTGHREILTQHIQERLRGYRKSSEFRTTTGVFQYSPDVIIHEPQGR